MKPSVVFNNVTKMYKMYGSSSERLKGSIAPKRYGEDFYAVKNISFTAEPGDVIGLVGINGAGKSTLSNLIAGVIPETTGEIFIDGQVSVISISSGLDNQLTGRDNIEYKCLMLGFSKKEIKDMMPDIIEFADIGKFIDQPVKNYSSGMKARLGFAISVTIDPDVLVIDEALSVGDHTFREKSFAKMNEFKDKGKTIFFVSHSIQQVRNFCNKVLWLEAGEVREYGEKKDVLPRYRNFLKEYRALSEEEKKNYIKLVARKRSKLEKPIMEETKATQSAEINLRTKKRRRKGFTYISKQAIILVFLLFSLSLALAIGKPWNLITKEETGEQQQVSSSKEDGTVAGSAVALDKNDESHKYSGLDEDVRFVAAESASIRDFPSLDAEITGYAQFGESFTIHDIEEGYDGIEWLKISSPDSDGEGWISGKIMQEVSSTNNDVELIKDIQSVVGNLTALELIVSFYDSVDSSSLNDYKLGWSDPVEVSIEPRDRAVLVEQLGEPSFEDYTNLLYQGERFTYIFKMENEYVSKLVIIEKVI